MSDDKTDVKNPAPTPATPPTPPRLVGGGLPPGPESSVPANGDAAPATPPIDVAAIRAKTGLSQEAFAQRYGFSKRTLQEWEQRRKRPTGAARSLLLVIKRHPKKVARALERDVLPKAGAETGPDDTDQE